LKPTTPKWLIPIFFLLIGSIEDFFNEDVFADSVPPKSGEVHVLKGGSFISDVTNATPFFHGGGPGNGYDAGFRIVKEVR